MRGTGRAWREEVVVPVKKRGRRRLKNESTMSGRMKERKPARASRRERLRARTQRGREARAAGEES